MSNGGSIRTDNKNARFYRAVLITFLTLVAGLLLIALSIDDVDLFKDELLKVPILDVDIKTSYYFILVPVVLLLAHLELLVRAHLIIAKKSAYTESISTLFPIPLLQVVKPQHQALFYQVLKALVGFMLCVLPMVVLAYLMYKFLPYQSFSISVWHAVAIIIDVLMTSYFRLSWEPSGKGKIYKAGLSILTSAIALALGFVLVKHPYIQVNFSSDPLRVNVPSMYKLEVVSQKGLYVKTEEKSSEVCDSRFQSPELDFSDRWYIQANLSGLFLCYPILQNTRLQGAYLRDAKFQRAALQGAQFQGADLEDAQFQGADLEDTQFQEASLQGVQFQGSALHGAQFQGADLEDAQFQEASLQGVQFQGAVLLRAQFQGANLEDAQFQGAPLLRAQFQGANLEDAQFQGADLWRAQFQGASLEDAQFQAADLREAQWQGIQSTESNEGPSYGRMPFEERIQVRRGIESDLGRIIISGGIDSEHVERIYESMGDWVSAEQRDEIIASMKEHVDREVVYAEDLPPIEVQLGVYDEEAEGWIKEYTEALSK